MDRQHTLQSLLVNAVYRESAAIAVEDPERAAAITYGDLDTLSDRLRDLLIGHGVEPGDRVGIYAPKSIGTVIAIFGTLKAGAAYVPLDATAPPARNAYIVRDCSVSVILVARLLIEGLRAAANGDPLATLEVVGNEIDRGTHMLLLQGPTGGGASAVADQANLDLAYILYTSGSTGKPKGVMHTQASALSFIDWCSEVFEPTARDRFSSYAPFHFDLSILDLYVSLKHGATLVLIGENLGKYPQRLAPLIAERQISVWYSTPSILQLLLDFGLMERYDYSTLRLVLFAGEVFSVKHLRSLQAVWPHASYFNLYGPTETNVCTYYEVPDLLPADWTGPLPIGRTCSNDRTRVMNAQEFDVPVGEEGELYVTGGSVMQGYWNLTERTTQAFFRGDEGTRWYRTGDFVREASDGNYIFISRRDRMVKRRGYRVELGEIEAALSRHPAVLEAAVIALADEENGVRIQAFLRTTEDHPSMVDLKQFCAANLPLYMVPDRFSFQSSLPKTSTDKIDYQALKELT